MSHTVFSLTIMFVGVHGMVQPQDRSDAFKSVSSNIHTLEAQLEEMNLKNKQALVSHQGEYEAKLQAQRAANVQLDATKTRLQQALDSVRKENFALRKRAAGLQEDIDITATDLKTVQVNLSTALEVVYVNLNESAEAAAAPELKILTELEAEEKDREAEDARKRRFGEIGKLVQLQVAAREDPRGLAADFVSVLNGNIKDLNADYEKQENQLLAKFEHLSEIETKKHKVLLEEVSDLETRNASLVNTKERLRVAVTQLEGRLAHLQELGSSVRMYAQRVGIRPAPLSRFQSIDESHKAGATPWAIGGQDAKPDDFTSSLSKPAVDSVHEAKPPQPLPVQALPTQSQESL